MNIDLCREKERDEWRRKEGEPPYLSCGGSFLISSSSTSGDIVRARGGVSGGRNSGHQDNNHNSIKRLLTYSVTQGGRGTIPVSEAYHSTA